MLLPHAASKQTMIFDIAPAGRTVVAFVIERKVSKLCFDVSNRMSWHFLCSDYCFLSMPLFAAEKGLAENICVGDRDHSMLSFPFIDIF
jgi:hypothetical protein